MLKMNFGLTSEIAYSGEQAVSLIQERLAQGHDPFKLIIMDINMHGMDGVQATSLIRKAQRNSQRPSYIVAHTAITEQQLGNFRSKGFDDFLCKPVFQSQLEEIIDRAY